MTTMSMGSVVVRDSFRFRIGSADKTGKDNNVMGS
jgi:hypothetical protein